MIVIVSRGLILLKQGGGNFMMWGYSGMMNGGFGFLALIFWIVLLTDLILLGLWLWKQVNKK